jgi:hypothetical protein
VPGHHAADEGDGIHVLLHLHVVLCTSISSTYNCTHYQGNAMMLFLAGRKWICLFPNEKKHKTTEIITFAGSLNEKSRSAITDIVLYTYSRPGPIRSHLLQECAIEIWMTTIAKIDRSWKCCGAPGILPTQTVHDDLHALFSSF